MSDYQTYPAVDSGKNFPPSVREALAAAAEFISQFARLDVSGDLVVGATKVEPTPAASLNVEGWARAVFIPNGGTLPSPIGNYTIVIELE